MESPVLYEYCEIPAGMTCAEYRRRRAERKPRRHRRLRRWVTHR